VTYFKKIKFSGGTDPNARVDPLVELPGGTFKVTLRVKGALRAKALATLLVSTKTFGNIKVHVKVRTSEGTFVNPITGSLSPQQIAALYCIVFHTNP
jgi:hypothetical protein